jgi:hypothetical protein
MSMFSSWMKPAIVLVAATMFFACSDDNKKTTPDKDSGADAGECEGTDFHGKTCNSVTMGAQKLGSLTCVGGVIKTTGCTAASGTGGAGTGGAGTGGAGTGGAGTGGASVDSGSGGTASDSGKD